MTLLGKAMMLNKKDTQRAAVKALRQLAAENNWTVVHEFVDYGFRRRQIYRIKPDERKPKPKS